MRGQRISSWERWCTEMMRRVYFSSLIFACLLLGCTTDRSQPKAIALATTTSTQDSGLLDVLLPAFEQESGVKVKVVAVGSGQALELGRRGDADVLLTHSPEAEKKFMDEGWGEKRLAVMHNDFVIVGPAEDAFCDRATYLALRNEVELVVLVEGDERLVNRYSVITVSPEKHPHVQRNEASRFADFLLSPSGQKIIGAFGIERYGQALFFPDAQSAVRD